MTLQRLIYCSNAQPGLNFHDINALATQSRRKNRSSNICGSMLYGQARFLQVLEGEANALRYLYQKIEQDRRHYDLKLISKETIERPIFQQWGMAIIFWEDALNQKQHSTLLKTVGSSTFDPFSWEAVTALNLLAGLSKEFQADPETPNQLRSAS